MCQLAVATKWKLRFSQKIVTGKLDRLLQTLVEDLTKLTP